MDFVHLEDANRLRSMLVIMTRSNSAGRRIRMHEAKERTKTRENPHELIASRKMTSQWADSGPTAGNVRRYFNKGEEISLVVGEAGP